MKNIEKNFNAPYTTDFIELDNPKMDVSLNEIVNQVIDKISQTGTEVIKTDGVMRYIKKNGYMTPVNHVSVIVDVDNPAIEAYLVVKLINDIFIKPSKKVSNMPIFTLVDIIVAPTENDLVIID
jgi:hypothetical protein